MWCCTRYPTRMWLRLCLVLLGVTSHIKRLAFLGGVLRLLACRIEFKLLFQNFDLVPVTGGNLFSSISHFIYLCLNIVIYLDFWDQLSIVSLLLGWARLLKEHLFAVSLSRLTVKYVHFAFYQRHIYRNRINFVITIPAPVLYSVPIGLGSLDLC